MMSKRIILESYVSKKKLVFGNISPSSVNMSIPRYTKFSFEKSEHDDRP